MIHLKKICQENSYRINLWNTMKLVLLHKLKGYNLSQCIWRVADIFNTTFHLLSYVVIDRNIDHSLLGGTLSFPLHNSTLTKNVFHKNALWCCRMTVFSFDPSCRINVNVSRLLFFIKTVVLLSDINTNILCHLLEIIRQEKQTILIEAIKHK
jgi:hypothetical protein